MKNYTLINNDLKKAFLDTVKNVKTIKLAEVKIGAPVFVENQGMLFAIAKNNNTITFDNGFTVDFLTAIKTTAITKA